MKVSGTEAAAVRGETAARGAARRVASARGVHGRAPRSGRGRPEAPTPSGGAARARLEVPGLFGDPARAARLEQALRALPRVRSARASARTGRVLVVCDAVAIPPEVHDAILAHALPGAPPPPSMGRAASGLAAGARALLRRVKDPGAWAALRRALRPPGAGAGADPAAEDAAPAWHAQPPDAVAAELGVDPAAGLGRAEAQRIRREVGPNVLAGVEPRSPLEILAAQVFTVPAALLGGAAGVSLLLGDVLEAGAILAVFGSNVAIGYFTESRAEELLHAWGKLRVERARVVRDGRARSIAAAELVPGDVLLLRAGDAIAADARVVAADGLAVDESTLTGESEPSEKRVDPADEGAALADRRGMVHAGTVVASGEGRAVVVATGQRTELGRIQRALSRAEERAAPLEQELAAIGRTLAGLGLASAVVVGGVGLLRGEPLRAIATGAVALGVAAIPEGFSAVGTTALALASRRLRSRGIVIRRLAAAETLGAVSVVCADKTGTLTENRMRVTELFLPGEGIVRVEQTGEGVRLATRRGRALGPERVHDLARIAALNADVEVTDAGEITQGSGTERGLVELALAVGYPVPARRRAARRVAEARRSAERAYMVTMHDHPELGHIELVKGAPEQVLARCDLPDDEREEALRRNEAMASRGLRVLACAWRRTGAAKDDAPLVFSGLVGLHDPARPGVREALATLAAAGIETVMLTGDQERTAVVVGEALGIAREAVHSRVTPEAKLDVVRELQARGRVVAMTGDGVNDGPALKAADVGVAMGRRGTDIARAVADVVLAEDDLPSLTEAVREGRRLYDNIRRAIDYFVATNSSEVLVMLAGAFAGVAPLTPLQLLWINLLTDVAPALALALEPAEPGVMRRPPRDARTRLLGPADWRRLGLEAARMAGASLAAYGAGAARRDRRTASTMAFASLMTSQLLHTLSCRADAPRAGDENPHVHRAVLGTFALQALALGSPALRRLLRAAPLGAVDLAAALALGALPALLRSGRGLLDPPGRAIVAVAGARPDAGERGRPATKRSRRKTP